MIYLLLRSPPTSTRGKAISDAVQVLSELPRKTIDVTEF